MNRDTLERPYWMLKSVIAPGLKPSQCVYETTLTKYHDGASLWLDVGCGRNNLLPSWRVDQEHALVAKSNLVVGLDRDLAALAAHGAIGNRVQGDISNLPFANETFDVITANMVFEHLKVS